MSIDFNLLDFSESDINNISKDVANIENNENNNNIIRKYDKTTTETYRIKRLYKIDPLTDQQIPEHLIIEFKNIWNPYTGKILEEDVTGPLCFNSLSLYDYYFSNRFKGIWNPPQNEFQGYYGEYLGVGLSLEIKSRGTNPEKYLYRLPIIDCYLPPEHNLAIITMGPLLTDEQIDTIDRLVGKYHKNKNNFTSLKKLKELYDNAICSESELAVNSSAKTWFKSNNYKLNKNEHLEKFNRFNVDKLVNLKY
jgi:hypothetical protein